MKNIRKRYLLFAILAVLLLSVSVMKTKCYADEGNVIIFGDTGNHK